MYTEFDSSDASHDPPNPSVIKATFEKQDFKERPVNPVVSLRQVKFVSTEGLIQFLVSLDGVEALKNNHGIVRD
jgi:hypothetical protein